MNVLSQAGLKVLIANPVTMQGLIVRVNGARVDIIDAQLPVKPAITVTACVPIVAELLVQTEIIPVSGSIVRSVALKAVDAEPKIELIEYYLGPQMSTPEPVPYETLTESLNTPTYWVT